MRQIRLPKWKRTFEFVDRLARHITFGTIASKSGKCTDVAEAWGRPPECDEYPSGTGKKDPSQTVIRLIGLAHEKDPGLAREWADVFPEYVEFLDCQAATTGKQSACEFAAISVKEHADVIAKVLQSGELEGLWTEVMQADAAWNQLKACVREEMKRHSVIENEFVTTNGRPA